MATILVVDDHSVNREFLSVLFNYAGHRVLESRNGAEALDAARTHLPDLIISDIFMPVMDGLEFARQLRADPSIAQIPVIFYTATYRLSDAHGLAQSCGVTCVLPKPSEPNVILAAVASALGTDAPPEPSSAPPVAPRLAANTLPLHLRELTELQQRLQAALQQGMALLGDDGAFHKVSEHLTVALSTVQSLSLRLAALLELGLVLAAERDPKHLLNIACRAAQDIMRTKYVAVGVLDAEGTRLHSWACHGLMDVHEARFADFDPHAGVFGRVLAQGIAICTNDVNGDPMRMGLFGSHPPIDTLLAVPLPTASGTAGWIYFADKIDKSHFNDEDELFAQTLAAQLGSACGSLALCEEIQRNAGALRSEVAERMRATDELRESELRFRQLAENVQEVFLLTDPQEATVFYVSPRYTEVWGRSCESLYAAPQSWADAIHPDDRERMSRARATMKLTGTIDAEYRIVRDDGAIRWIHARGQPIHGADGTIQRIAGIAEDITERKEQEDRIARLNRIRAVQSAITSAILRLPTRDEILREACRIAIAEGIFPMAWAGVIDPDTGEGHVIDLAGDYPDYLSKIRFTSRIDTYYSLSPASRAVRERVAAICNNVAADATMGPKRDLLVAIGMHSLAAFPLLVEDRVAGVLVLFSKEVDFFDQDEITLLNWVANDLSFALDHVEKAERINYLAYYDALTTLPNASLFEDRLSQLILSSVPEEGELAVVLLDVKDFRQFNDSLGRQAGDRLLKLLATRLVDTLPEPRSIGRIGSDTFAIAAVSERKDAAADLRTRIFAAFDRPFLLDGKEVPVCVQAGIALYPADGENATSLFKNAEAALQHAKQSGLAYLYYASEINTRNAARIALEAQLRNALAEQQFVLHYQPRVDLINGQVVGAEALIRWQDPDSGLVGPNEFIGLAEDSGLIVPIGAWVLMTVCMQQAAWRAAQVDIVPIAVNLSSIQLQKSDLLATVDAALAQSRLDAKFLDLELTETAMMQNPERSADTLRELRLRGVGLALDDFGTGFSSLSHLKHFPFHAVKIDRAFVSSITHSPEDAAIAKAIIAMAHSMNLKVVAEGIETEGQLRYLRSQGCDEMQGNYFSPAVTLEAFESILRSGRRLKPATEDAVERTLLIVDDEQGIRAALNRALRREGYRILTAASGAEGLDALSVNTVQVIISDQRMPGMSGTDFLSTVRQLHPDTVRIILSGYTDFEVVTQAVNRGAVFKFLTKPWDDEQLRDQVRDAFRLYKPRATRDHAE